MNVNDDLETIKENAGVERAFEIFAESHRQTAKILWSQYYPSLVNDSAVFCYAPLFPSLDHT
jgi:hypothetical protein